MPQHDVLTRALELICHSVLPSPANTCCPSGSRACPTRTLCIIRLAVLERVCSMWTTADVWRHGLCGRFAGQRRFPWRMPTVHSCRNTVDSATRSPRRTTQTSTLTSRTREFSPRSRHCGNRGDAVSHRNPTSAVSCEVDCVVCVVC